MFNVILPDKPEELFGGAYGGPSRLKVLIFWAQNHLHLSFSMTITPRKFSAYCSRFKYTEITLKFVIGQKSGLKKLSKGWTKASKMGKDPPWVPPCRGVLATPFYLTMWQGLVGNFF